VSRTSVLAFSLFVVLAAGAIDWVCGCSTAPSRAAEHAGGHRPFARRIEGLPGLANVAEVASGVYRGAQPKGREGWSSLKNLGVKTIVSLRSLHTEKEEAIAAGLEPIAIPLVADARGSRPPTREDVKKFLSIVRDPAKQPVYFHCAFGEDRTGTMCAVYRMEVDGWSPDDAFAEMEHFGFNHVWTSLREFVQGYELEAHDSGAR
jgi:protein tyrosine/serine phosphatase